MGRPRKIRTGSIYIVKPSQYGGGERVRIMGAVADGPWKGMYYGQQEVSFRTRTYTEIVDGEEITYNTILDRSELGEELKG